MDTTHDYAHQFSIRKIFIFNKNITKQVEFMVFYDFFAMPFFKK